MTKNQKRFLFSYVSGLVFVFVGGFFAYNELRFLIFQTGETTTTTVKNSLALYRIVIRYSYNVDDIEYEGKASTLVRPNFDRAEYRIRYLIKDPSISMVGDLIISEFLLDVILVVIPFSCGALYLTAGLLKKLPPARQAKFDKFLEM
ncbi:MAG: hypothetical protein LBK74_08260 [Treponema sp.]|jgi:hypothetical protein|nr:hypothetical protein [Treponema sp.]